MVWCPNCSKDVTAEDDYQAGYSYFSFRRQGDRIRFRCCPLCGAVLVEGTYENAIAFKEEGGMIGQILSDEKQPQQGGGTSERGFREISLLVDQLRVHPRDDTIDAALRLYKMAVSQGFLKGRRSNQVAACCIYIMCRTDRRPYLLIDFSDALRVNVYVLGCVFLDLCWMFKLDEHPIVLSPIDPSLFIHRYVDRLNCGDATSVITQSALKLIKSMNRDWIQTGRKPSGICAAALFISCQMHGVPKMKRDIIYIARIGVSTVAKRLTEFSQTRPGKLNTDEFHREAMKMERMEQELLTCASIGDRKSGCHHLDNGVEHFANGMCKGCYTQYLAVSGGIFQGTSDPPSYRKRKKNSQMTVCRMLKMADQFESNEEGRRLLEQEMREAPGLEEVEAEMDIALSSQNVQATEFAGDPVPLGHALSLSRLQSAGDSQDEDLPFDEEIEETVRSGILQKRQIPEALAEEEPVGNIEVDLLEDIDDEEVADYILSPEEAKQKSLWWREVYKDHLERAANRKEKPTDKEKKRRRSSKKMRSNLPEYSTAFEAVKGMLEDKGLSSKINYDNLEALFAEDKPLAAFPSPLPSQKKESFFLRSLSFRRNAQSNKKRLDGLFD